MKGLYVFIGAVLVGSSVFTTFGGLFILWQLDAQPSTNGCYNLPLGFAGAISAYQGSCPFNQIPNYYAGDLGMILGMLGLPTLFAGMIFIVLGLRALRAH